MPRIFLSPSTQEYNPYITGNGSEEYFMNQIADAMEPYLLANTIRFTRNTPDMTAASSIRLANSGSYDFYLALHSNGSTDGTKEGAVRGVIAFYYPTSANGRRAADIFVKKLKRHLSIAGQGLCPCHHHTGRGPPALYALRTAGAGLPRQHR